MDPKYQDAGWLRSKYWEEELTQEEIANLSNVSDATISRQMDKLGVESRTSGGKPKVKYHNEGWLRREYLEEEKSQTQIAKECDVSHRTIGRWLDKHGIEKVGRIEAMSRGKKYTNHDWLYEKYHIDRMSMPDIGELCGVSYEAVRYWVHRHGIDIQPQYSIRTGGSLIGDEKWFREKYCEEELLQEEIAELAGVGISTVGKWRKRHNIESRRNGISGSDNSKWIGGKQEFACDVCSAVEYRYPSHAEGESFYCSYRCMSVGYKEREDLRGENHPSWKGGYDPYYGPTWKSQRRKTLIRDQYRCQRCGVISPNLDRELDVHHIIPFRVFNDSDIANRLANLISLCRSCHPIIENRYNPISPKN